VKERKRERGKERKGEREREKGKKSPMHCVKTPMHALCVETPGLLMMMVMKIFRI